MSAQKLCRMRIKQTTNARAAKVDPESLSTAGNNTLEWQLTATYRKLMQIHPECVFVHNNSVGGMLKLSIADHDLT